MVAPFIAHEAGSIRDMEHVLWEVRLTILMQLVHWKLRSADAWTIANTSSIAASDTLQKFEARHAQSRPKFQA